MAIALVQAFRFDMTAKIGELLLEQPADNKLIGAGFQRGWGQEFHGKASHSFEEDYGRPSLPDQ